jgi:hypothetical protein
MKAELRPTEVSTESKHMLCSGCHDTEDNCEYCHRTEELKPFDHKSRTGFDLKGFHSALNCIECHPKKGEFAGLNSDCSGCHANWSPENFNHGVTGIVLDETHSEFDCESCHLENFVDKPTCDMCHDEDISYPDSVPGKIKAN